MFMHCFCLFLLLAPAADEKKPTPYPRTDLLIEAADVAKLIKAKTDDKPVLIVDVRPKDKYDAGRIPGAVWVDAVEWNKAFGNGDDKKGWAARLGDLAIHADIPVIIYDDTAAKDAARIWWILRYWGVKDARLLNGGWTAWRESGGDVSRQETVLDRKANARFTGQNHRLADKDDVLEGLKDKRFQIIDARSLEEHCGDTKTAKRNGAIPGAVHLEWSDLIDKKSQRFKGPDELNKLFKDAGIDLNKPAVTYCQSGGRAAVMTFALELMGAKNVRNYYKSWAEWGNADDTPIEKPKPKK